MEELARIVRIEGKMYIIQPVENIFVQGNEQVVSSLAEKPKEAKNKFKTGIYSPEENLIVKKMWNSGSEQGEIAKELNRSVISVNNKIHNNRDKLKLKRKYRVW